MFCILLVILLLIISYKVYGVDTTDRTRPFGTDNYKNNKYAKGLSGEDYGVGTYWGKPSKNDKIVDNLDKIQWLSENSRHDVIWRRALILGVVAGIAIAFSLDINIILKEPSKLLFIVLIIFIISYFSINYYTHHVLWRRTKFINTHIRKIKKTLSLPQNNKIYDNPLI
jgi:hypothetical protein